VLLAFLNSTCPHCKLMSKQMEWLAGEFPRDKFQPVGALIDEGADIKRFIAEQKLTFPVSVVPRSEFVAFAGLRPEAPVMAPTLVLIDHLGVIRAQSATRGSAVYGMRLHDPDFLRAVIKTLVGRIPRK